MKTEVAKQTQPITFESSKDKLAYHFIESGYFKGSANVSQAIVKIQAGKELGIPEFCAMQNLWIITGRITMSAALITALIEESGIYDFKIIQHDDKICKLEFLRKRAGEKEWTSRGFSEFSFADAEKAGLTTKDNWKYPRSMLFNRALTQGARWFCAPVFKGPVYTKDELEDSEPETKPEEGTEAVPSFKAMVMEEEKVSLEPKVVKAKKVEITPAAVELPEVINESSIIPEDPEKPIKAKTVSAQAEEIPTKTQTIKEIVDNLNVAVVSAKTLDVILKLDNQWKAFKTNNGDQLPEKIVKGLDNKILGKILELEERH